MSSKLLVFCLVASAIFTQGCTHMKSTETQEVRNSASVNTFENTLSQALQQIDLSHKMIFNEIRPGKFQMGNAKVETTITEPFEMMATEVTQLQWSSIKIALGEKNPRKINPSNFKTGKDSQKITIDGIDVQMKPNHPVEMVSHDDVTAYIAGLNKLSGTGDQKVQLMLEKLIPGHKKGDIYDLPTEAQWEFTMRDRGDADKKYFDQDTEAQSAEYGWHYENSGNETHAVAQLKPRIIDGKPFYDLEGNVWEWNKDWYNVTLGGGVNPQGPNMGSYRVVRGGGWGSAAQNLASSNRGSGGPGNSSDVVGFRLVRTRP